MNTEAASDSQIVHVLPMTFSLGKAATIAGVNKSTILRSIRNGKISARRTARGTWAIEVAELRRVYPQPMLVSDEIRELIARLQTTIDELRADRDAWREQAQYLARNDK